MSLSLPLVTTYEDDVDDASGPNWPQFVKNAVIHSQRSGAGRTRRQRTELPAQRVFGNDPELIRMGSVPSLLEMGPSDAAPLTSNSPV